MIDFGCCSEIINHLLDLHGEHHEHDHLGNTPKNAHTYG